MHANATGTWLHIHVHPKQLQPPVIMLTQHHITLESIGQGLRDWCRRNHTIRAEGDRQPK